MQFIECKWERLLITFIMLQFHFMKEADEFTQQIRENSNFYLWDLSAGKEFPNLVDTFAVSNIYLIGLVQIPV